MNIKSLLLGSAAAFAAVSGAQAADAIVAAEPEPVEYVRVCDAYGTGYFYIPGTETCLKIGGYLRFEVGYGFGEGYEDNGVGGSGDQDWESHTRAHVSFDAKSDTEYGPLTSRIVLESNYYGGGGPATRTTEFVGWSNAAAYGTDNTIIDEAYLELAGIRAGRFASWWDNDFSGESDLMTGNDTKWNAIRYEYDSDSFNAGLSLDELPADFDGAESGLGIDAMIGGKAGVFTWQVYGGYDAAMQDGSVTARMGAEIGPGVFELAGIYSSGPNTYYQASEWSVIAQYALKINDKFTITPEAQYSGRIREADDEYHGGSMWRGGVTLDYKIVDDLTLHTAATYVAENHDFPGTDDSHYVEGFVRLERDF
ncbi:porin [Rhizobium sp. 21-4511-3d]